MSKILIEGNKVIIDGHANDLETCNTLTNLCDELSTSDKFRTVKYESGYGEFESVSENEEKKFAGAMVMVSILSNDGTTSYYSGSEMQSASMEVTSKGVTIGNTSVYTYSGNKVFLGLADVRNSTSATYSVGYVGNPFFDVVEFYIVEADPGYQVNIQSNDGTTTLAQNATVDSVVVTATGAQLKCGDAVKATYTYAGSKLFAGLATSANTTAPMYKIGDTIDITAETTLYIVENIIIPEHHSSLNELFTNIATVIREKTGDTNSIAAADFPSVIRERLKAAPVGVTILGLELLDLNGNIISEDTSEAFLATRTEGYKLLSKNMQNDLMACYDIVMSDNFSIGDLYPEFEGYSVHDVYALSDAKGNINPCLEAGATLKIRVYFEVPPLMNFAILRFDGDIGELVSMPDDYIEYEDIGNDINIVLSTITGVFVILTKEG